MKKIIFLVLATLTLSFKGFSADTLKVEIEPYRISAISESMEETNSSVKIGRSKIESTGNLKVIRKKFSLAIEESVELKNDTSSERWKSLSLPDLDAVQKKWSKYLGIITEISHEISAYNKSLEEYRDKLISYEKRWQLTFKSASKDSIMVMEERIQSIITMLENEVSANSLLMQTSFNLVDSITAEKLFVGDVISRIKLIYEEKKQLIWVKDSESFIEMMSMKDDSIANESSFASDWITNQHESRRFIKKNANKIWFQFFLFILFSVIFFYLKKHVDTLTEEAGERMRVFKGFLNKPLAAALLFNLTISFWYYGNLPAMLTEQLMLVNVILGTWILIGVIQTDYKWALIGLSFLYVLERTHVQFSHDEMVQRWFMLVEGMAALAFGIYLSRPKSIIYREGRGIAVSFLKLFPIIPIFLALAVYANLVGSVLLSKIILSSILKTVGGAIIIYIFVTVIEGMLEYLMIGPLKTKIKLIEAYGDEIRRWTRLILRTWALYIIIRLLFGQLQIRESFNDWWEQLMVYGWEFGEVSLTVSLIVDFVLIILIFSVVANITRAFLEIELLSRFDLKKGVPMAIAVMTRYLILVLGFFMAVAAAGISLDKLGFLAGALGVGIGFGLQNVVGNFVSGLILIFERPIHIDDVIVTENIEGVVKEVGIRASKIRTWEGAEVIVPNYDLISRQVTNWTLSDTKRRREQILKLEYGSDPNQVIKIIKTVLEKSEDVLKDPPPMVLFLGYQQFSIDFRVLFWLNGNLLQASSDIALSIHNELKKGKIELAVPRQRMIWEDKKLDPVSKKRTPRKPSAGKSTDPDDKPIG